MWLHHRDMNVSGKPRCPGNFVADDAMLALPSDPRSDVLFPMTGIGVGKSQIPGTHIRGHTTVMRRNSVRAISVHQ
jgi:hypothetical protein